MNYTPDLLSTSLKMLSALGIVLGGMLVFFYFMKRYLKRDFSGSKEKLVRVLASSYIGVKKNISLIEIPGSVLVVGITNDNITLLSKIEDKDILNKLKLSEEDRNQVSFSEHLQKLSSKFKAHNK
jgi:flagellar protein FliO/FliZ